MQIAKQMDLLTNMRVHSFLGKFGLITQAPDSIQKISDFNFLENLLAHCQAKLQINTSEIISPYQLPGHMMFYGHE